MARRTFVSLLVAALLLAGAFWVWKQRAPSVPALVVQPSALLRTLQFSARVASASRVDVGATLTGRVLQVAVVEGAQVRRGELLVRLEDAELKSALSQALAGEQQAAARLAGLRSTGRSSAQAAAAQAESVLLAAQADLRRTGELVSTGFLSPQRLDDARRAEAVAQAQLAGAQAQGAAIAEQGSELAQAQAQWALARAVVTAAQARLAQALVSAPADARVLARLVEPGQIVQPGRALLTLALSGPVQLVAPVDERYLQQLQPGQVASVRADAFPLQRFAAQVLSISPLIDAQRGAVDLKFSVAQPPAFLREDMTLSVEVETARRAKALVVPLTALRADEGNAATLWLAREGRVKAVGVRLGLRTLEAAEVVQGLNPGDTVLLGAAPAPGGRVRADTTAAPPQVGGVSGSSAVTDLSNAMGR